MRPWPVEHGWRGAGPSCTLRAVQACHASGAARVGKDTVRERKHHRWLALRHAACLFQKKGAGKSRTTAPRQMACCLALPWHRCLQPVASVLASLVCHCAVLCHAATHFFLSVSIPCPLSPLQSSAWHPDGVVAAWALPAGRGQSARARKQRPRRGAFFRAAMPALPMPPGGRGAADDRPGPHRRERTSLGHARPHGTSTSTSTSTSASASTTARSAPGPGGDPAVCHQRRCRGHRHRCQAGRD